MPRHALETDVAQTITEGVTTSPPSQDAVFNALADKQPHAGAKITISDTAPSDPAVGDIWIDNG